jgi:hypothetical protein
MKRSLCLGLFLAGFVGLSAAAQADVANFEANCTWNASYTYFTCVFDGQRPAASPSSCSSGTSPLYSWDFADGTPRTSASYNSTISHVYSPPPSGTYGYWPTLYVTCGTNPAVSAQRYMCVFGFGVPGCIQVNGIWS